MSDVVEVRFFVGVEVEGALSPCITGSFICIVREAFSLFADFFGIDIQTLGTADNHLGDSVFWIGLVEAFGAGCLDLRRPWIRLRHEVIVEVVMVTV